MLGYACNGIALIASLLGNLALADSQARAPDTIDRELVLCIESNLFGGCWDKILKSNFDYKQPAPEKAIEVMEKNFKAWLGDKTIYKVHRGPVEKAAGIFEGYTYAVERDDGEIVGLAVGFRKTLGKWHIYELNGSPKESYIRKLLGVTLRNAEDN